MSSIPNQRQLYIPKSPLYIAIEKIDIEEIKSLLTNGANLKEEEPNLLIKAVHQQSAKIVNLLLDHGSAANATDEFGRTALYYCFQRLYIIYHKYQPNDSLQSCSISIEHLTKEMIKLLLERGADPNVSKNIYFPLHTAVINKDKDIVRLLLQHNVDINCQDTEGNTALHYAVLIENDIDILVDLLAYNPDIDIQNVDGRTPIHFVSVAYNSDALDRLLGEKFNINCIDDNGNTPLHCVCEQYHELEYINMLINNDADVNARNSWGKTPLHSLAWSETADIEDSVEIIEEFLERNADINAVDDDGKTPLIYASYTVGFDDTFEAFIRCDADVHFKDESGKPPLHLVAEDLNSIKFKILLKCGADINSICNDNKTALDCFIMKVNEDNNNNITDCYDAKKCIRIFKSAREHIIKLKCAQLHVYKRNIDLIYNNIEFINSMNAINDKHDVQYRFKIADVMRIEDKCNAEISRLKKTRFDGICSNDLLSKNLHDLIKFVDHKESYGNVFVKDDFKKKFPLYADVIKNRYNAVLNMSKIVDIVTNQFDSLEIINKLPVLCRDKIFRYLNFSDWEVFLKAVNPRKIAS